MTYVHLANGEVKQIDDKEFTKRFGDEPPRFFRDNGKEHQIIGVYPDEVEYDDSDEKDEADRQRQERESEEDRAQFAEWKRNRDNPPSSANDVTAPGDRQESVNDDTVHHGQPVTIERNDKE